MKRAKFSRVGYLAIVASVLALELDVVEADPIEERGGVAIVTIRGPLTQHPDPMCPWDSYDAIRVRFAAAVASSCSAIVLRIDSPGGDVAGCFELARDMRSMAAKSGKRLIAFGDGMTASAGYALACSASQIWTSSTGAIGSVGVAHMLVDTTAADRAMGLNFAVITSGARKADGNPHVEITDATIGAYQAAVDGLADLFFELVASSRPISAEAVRGYEAGIFHGAKAQAVGLVDGVCTFDQLLETVSGPGAMTTMKLTDIKAALVKAAEGDDDEAAEAKKMLAALYGKAEEGEPEEKKDPPEEEKKPEEKAEAAPPEKGDEKKKDDEAKASAAALARVGVVERELAGMKAASAATERATILATRTDLTPGQVTLLAAQPLEQMKRTLAAFPAASAPTALTGVRGKVPTAGSRNTSAGDMRQATALSPHAERLDMQMGLSRPGPSITLEGDKLVCRTMTPTQARAHLKSMATRDGAQEAGK